jgi:hypothetical protein
MYNNKYNNTNPTMMEQEQRSQEQEQCWNNVPPIPIPQPPQNWNNVGAAESSFVINLCRPGSFSFCSEPAPPTQPPYFDPGHQTQPQFASPGFIVQPGLMAQQWQLQQNIEYFDMINYGNNYGNGIPAQGINNGNIGNNDGTGNVCNFDNNGMMMPQVKKLIFS